MSSSALLFDSSANVSPLSALSFSRLTAIKPTMDRLGLAAT